jgi:septal ring factor EnvC (AmiA/AmiB activator)
MTNEMNETKADSSYKKVKSELFHIWKKARLLYDMITEEKDLHDSVKKNITSAYEAIDESIRYIEYDEIFPNKKEETREDNENNFLTNQDKRYPVPVNSESGDQFVTRCILQVSGMYASI